VSGSAAVNNADSATTLTGAYKTARGFITRKKLTATTTEEKYYIGK
jgi:hypothetical protein